MRVFDPTERTRFYVGFGHKAADGFLQRDDRMEDAALQPLFGQFGEEAFDSIDP